MPLDHLRVAVDRELEHQPGAHELGGQLLVGITGVPPRPAWDLSLVVGVSKY